MVMDKVANLKYRFWVFVSFIVVSLAIFILDLTELLPSFVGTRLTLYSIVFILFATSLYFTGKASKHKKRK